MTSKSKSKLFQNFNMNAHHHHRNFSTTITQSLIIPHNISTKKSFIKHKKTQSKASLFKINPKALDYLASYGTNNKQNNEEKEEEKDSKDKIKEKNTLIETVDKNKFKKIKESVNNDRNVNKKKTSKSVKKIKHSNKTKNKNIIINENYDYNLDKKDDVLIIRNYDARNAKLVEHYLSLPEDLKKDLTYQDIKIVSPNRNIEGNYSNYIHSVANSLKKIIEFDYDKIFSKENNNNIKYVYYTSSMNLDVNTPKKKLLIIDLDETLIHSEFRTKENFDNLDYIVKTSKCNVKTFSFFDENNIYYMDVFFRPYLKLFLHEISQYFDLAIFTAAMKNYADTIIDYIDKNNEYFKFRLYRDACIPIQNKLYIKDLRIIKDYDPRNVLLMDNSLYSFMNQPSNGMLVNSFYMNHKDLQLISAKNFLINYISPCDDVRKECEKWYHFTELFYKGTSKEIKNIN